ncbi:MAG TPA: MBL fold metallo-hydrolase [Woeseiaceae bacterium]|jgi:glyoxylase-like metal-dependent hydrolase (beta-lactamase superfamily II)|nr:MBL fold metallo-hydrolase [Woeseiaceae bacterium]
MSRFASLFAAVCLAGALPAGAQEAEISFKSTELAPGLYMLEGEGGFAGGNPGLLTGDDGNILIDDGLEPLADTLLRAVTDVTGAPVDFVINTHVHADHTGGNAALHATGATIIGHDNVRKRLLDGSAARDGKPAPREALPQITFPDAITFHLNGHDVFIFHVAHAHTDGDAVVLFPDVDVIHAADVFFNGRFPFIDLDSGGSVDGYIRAQEAVLSRAGTDTRIIPGHGPLGTKDDLQTAHNMLVDARERIRKLVDAGKSEEEVLSADPLSRYDDDWSWEFITTERMTRTLYRGLTNSSQDH